MSESRDPSPAAATSASPAADPAAVYDRRLLERRGRVERWRRLEGLVSIARLVMVVAALVLAWLAVQNRLLSFAWTVLPAAAFVVLVVLHERLLQQLGRARRAVAFYRQGQARLADEWMGKGEPGERHLDPHHPYAVDLDLFGPGSLYELLCLARTRAGEDTLASWLLEPAPLAEVRARQAAVAELRDHLDLREDLSVLGTEVRSALDPEPLQAWAEAPARLRSPLLRVVLLGLAGANLLAAIGWAAWGWGPAPLLALGLVEVMGFLFLRQEIGEAVRGVDRASRDLALLAELLHRIEQEPLATERLAELRAELRAGGHSSGEQIRRLQKLADLLDSRRNAFFAPFALLLLWTSQLACAVETWRRRFGPVVVRWLEVVGEVEALSSLAAYAYEHPQDPFPGLLEGAEPRLEGRGLGHPLLPRAGCVRNDLELGPDRRALVVSGSNMSGKSTLLRTTGTAVVMALAGAPVRARQLRLTPLRVGASIRLQDSLQGGSSRFYAEITRLRQILELTAGEAGVLFLLDEILHGTNSHDRRIGAEAVVRAFVERGAIGLVTTHDLALARIAEAPGGVFHNVHFEDYLEAGRIHFDYRLRPGVVEHSNALALMREVGLEV